MKKLNSIIMDVQGLRGADVEIFGQSQTLREEVDPLTIDIIDILEDLKEYEVDMFIERPVDDEGEEWGEIEAEDVEEYLEELEDMGYIADVNDYKADNSYNWMAPVSNHFDFKIYDLIVTGGQLIEMKIHRYGDVRGNYTESFLLEFDDDYTFLETISENSKLVTVEVDEENYDV